MSKITESARNENCTMRLPGVCSFNPEETVWAHSNRGSDGKGMGKKAHDVNGAYACYACHQTYDRQRQRPMGLSLEEVEAKFTLAMKKSRQILSEKGLLSFEIPEKIDDSF